MFRKDGRKYNIKDTGNARDVALFVLLEITENSRKSNTILNETFEESERFGWGLTTTDRAFITKIVVGTLTRLISIDVVLSRFLKKSIKLQKPVIRGILRMSLYQLMYMDRVPHSAVCNEAVKLAKMHGLDGLSGFVNGVLRSAARDIEAGGEKTSVEGLEEAYKYSLPKWMWKLFYDEFGKEAACELAEALLFERCDTVRLNLSRIDAKEPERAAAESLMEDGFVIEPVDMEDIIRKNGLSTPDGRLPVVYKISGGDISRARAFKKGWLTVQDPASALVASYAAPKDSDVIIDVCAAPGGKSLALSDLMNGNGRIEARDVSSQKVRLINDNIKRCGFDNIKTQILDALKHDEESLYRADIVIADLPCSGLGVIAKKPDIKLNLKPYSVEELRDMQRDILENVSRYVKPKGRLIYSTCTVSKEENEQNAAWIADELGFKMISSNRLMPSIDNDGFYIAVFEKKY